MLECSKQWDKTAQTSLPLQQKPHGLQLAHAWHLRNARLAISSGGTSATLLTVQSVSWFVQAHARAFQDGALIVGSAEVCWDVRADTPSPTLDP